MWTLITGPQVAIQHSQIQREGFKLTVLWAADECHVVNNLEEREKQSKFNVTDQRVSEGVRPLGAQLLRKVSLTANLITYHTLTYLAYQFKLSGRHSSHIPEQISEI